MDKKYKEYLDDLRESGETNMYGATPYLMGDFCLEKREAMAILREWFESFDEPVNK